MLIKYTGPKESKRIERRSTTRGMVNYVFDPICDVTDKDTLVFLLHPDRKGLFEMVTENEESDNEDKPKAKTKKELVAEAESLGIELAAKDTAKIIQDKIDEFKNRDAKEE